MSTSKTSKRKQRAQSQLLEKGILATGLGIAFLAAPALLGGSTILKTVATALRTPGWLALAAGVVLLGLHFIVKRNAAPTAIATAAEPRRREPPLSRKPSDAVLMPFPTGTNQDALCTTRAEARSKPVPEGAWSPAVFAAIEWRRFEAVCETLFAQAGFETRAQSHGADGGVDIWLHSANAEGPVAVVQCKHWQGKPVGVKEMREFFGVMASHQLKRGTYATTSTYTDDALKFAKDNGINAMDGKALLALMAKRTPQQQQELLDVAYEGDYWRPTCASCGVKMVERTPAKGGARFWGCANFPQCRRTLHMAATV